MIGLQFVSFITFFDISVFFPLPVVLSCVVELSVLATSILVGQGDNRNTRGVPSTCHILFSLLSVLLYQLAISRYHDV